MELLRGGLPEGALRAAAPVKASTVRRFPVPVAEDGEDQEVLRQGRLLPPDALGEVIGIPAQAFGVYQVVTGVARPYRGYRQQLDAEAHPWVRKTGMEYGRDACRDVIPFGNTAEGILGGLQ